MPNLNDFKSRFARYCSSGTPTQPVITKPLEAVEPETGFDHGRHNSGHRNDCAFA